MGDQQAVIAFLSVPCSYGPGIERVEIIETHVSLVFLAGEHAYKLKRAIKYLYLDFSTPEHRRRARKAELALNRRTAPSLYLEVRALARMPDGKIGFEENGPAIDMRRFEQSSIVRCPRPTGRIERASDERARRPHCRFPCTGRTTTGSAAQKVSALFTALVLCQLIGQSTDTRFRRQIRSHSPVSSSRRSSSMPLKSKRETMPTTLSSSTIGRWR